MAKIFFRKYAIHLIIWAITLFYIMWAPNLYNYVFLSQGKPVRFDKEIPVKTNKIKYAISNLRPQTISGEDIYVLKGWAFLSSAADQTQYEQFLILKSASRAYFFPITNTQTPNLTSMFKELNIDLGNSGFSVNISKEFIQSAKYQIGFVFAHKTDGSIFYAKTDRTITRTPNKIQLDPK